MIKIFIDNTEADSTGIDFNITDTIGDITGVAVSQSPASDNISLPITNTNKKIFGFNDLLGTDNYWQGDGRIEVDGVIMLSGICKLLSVDDNFNIQIIGESRGWVDILGEDKLSDLDFSSLNHTVNPTNILAATSGNYIYPFVNYGFLSVHRWTKDFRPWLSVSHILSKIFSGYTIDSEILDTGDIADLYISLPEPIAATDLPDDVLALYSDIDTAQVYSQSLSAGNHSIAVTAFHVNFKTADTESSWFKTSGGNKSYYIPSGIAGAFRFKSTIYTSFTDFDVTVSSFYIYIKIKDTNGNTILDKTYSGLSTGDNTISIVTDTLWHDETTEVGYYVDISFSADITLTNAHTVVFSIYSTSTFEASGYKSIGSGYSYVFNDNLPDIKQIDFIKELINRYNLKIFLDQNTNILYLDSYDVFYPDTVIDWSTKLSDTNISLQNINHHSEVNFNFKVDDKDKFKDLDIANETIILTNGDKSLNKQSFFSKIYTFTDSYVFFNALPAIQQEDDDLSHTLTNLYNEPSFYYSSPIKLATLDNSASSVSWYLNEVSQSTIVNISNADFDITYYDTWKNIVETGRLVVGDFKISQAELSQITEVSSSMFITSWRIIRYKGQDYLCRINKITTNPMTKQTRVELIWY